jgi:coenzyme F420-reducing hydrogenase beta subunit
MLPVGCCWLGLRAHHHTAIDDSSRKLTTIQLLLGTLCGSTANQQGNWQILHEQYQISMYKESGVCYDATCRDPVDQ